MLGGNQENGQQNEQPGQNQIQSRSLFQRAFPWAIGGLTTVSWTGASLALTSQTITPTLVLGATGVAAAEIGAISLAGYGVYRVGRGIVNAVVGNKRKRNEEVAVNDQQNAGLEAPQEQPPEKRRATDALVEEMADLNQEQMVIPSEREVYLQHVAETAQQVDTLKIQLAKQNCKTLFTKLNNILKDAPDANFTADGHLDAEQPARNKLQFLRWEEKVLNTLTGTPKKEQAALKREIARKADTKLDNASNKPKI